LGDGVGFLAKSEKSAEEMSEAEELKAVGVGEEEEEDKDADKKAVKKAKKVSNMDRDKKAEKKAKKVC
jgi:hypothetical protein